MPTSSGILHPRPGSTWSQGREAPPPSPHIPGRGILAFAASKNTEWRGRACSFAPSSQRQLQCDAGRGQGTVGRGARSGGRPAEWPEGQVTLPRACFKPSPGSPSLTGRGFSPAAWSSVHAVPSARPLCCPLDLSVPTHRCGHLPKDTHACLLPPARHGDDGAPAVVLWAVCGLIPREYQ